MGLLRLGSGGGLVIALIFNIVALATPGWLVADGGTIGYGLFKYSNGAAIVKSNAEKVEIAFNILAMVTLLCASGLVLLAGKDEEKDQMGKIGGGLAILSAIFMMIGLAAYTGIYKANPPIFTGNIPWGYSYALAWTAFCLSMIGGVIAFVGK